MAQISKIGMHKLENNWLKTEEQITNYETYNNSKGENYEQAIQERSKMIYLLPLVVVIVAVTTFLQGTIFFRLATNASINFHRSLATTVIDASMEFFHIHYLGNILNRFSEDLLFIDEIVPYSMYLFLNGFVQVIGITFFLGTINRAFLVVALTLCVLPVLAIIFILRTGRALKRVEISTKHPFANFPHATPEGLPTIRSANMQNVLVEEFDRHLDLYTSASYLYWCWLRTVVFILHLYFVVYTIIIVIVVLIIDEDISAAHVGLVLTQLTMFQKEFDTTLVGAVKVEAEMIAVERILEYVRQKTEYKGGVAVEHWPQHHQIKFDNDPVLFTGTVRENIDLTGKYTDDEIWNVVRIVNLDKFFPNLDHRISSADLNLSLGQKQLLCLARAIICNNKIVIMDEVTANVDKKTEIMIHNIVRKEFASCMVILITHKLDYVLEYDKVMVLDGGSIVEFDRPSVLLNNQNGLFNKMFKKVT
ncbi:hypothetical protein MTP99_009498 [Tenebrio molitor]|nr:hypothetical protein MTP99_009498 [Tenebrio molitor]